MWLSEPKQPKEISDSKIKLLKKFCFSSINLNYLLVLYYKIYTIINHQYKLIATENNVF